MTTVFHNYSQKNCKSSINFGFVLAFEGAAERRGDDSDSAAHGKIFEFLYIRL
jgi:hypothetical protein